MPLFQDGWYEAVRCPDDQDQQQLFLKLSLLIARFASPESWHAYRLVQATHRLVIVVQQPHASFSISRSQHDQIDALLGTRPRMQLPANLLASLHDPTLHEHLKVGARSSLALLYTHTAPSLIPCGPPLPRVDDALPTPSQEENEPPSSPFALIDRVRQQGENSVFALLVPSLLDEMAPCFRLLVEEAEHVLFTASAEQMHTDIQALLDPLDLESLEGQQRVEQMAAETLTPLLQGTRSVLIVLEQPHHCPFGVVYGLFLHPCFPVAVLHAQETQQVSTRLELILQLARFKGFWNLDLLGEEGPLLRGGWNPLRARWQAEGEDMHFLHWLSWLVIAVRMLRRRYARTPEPPPFPQQEHRLREQVLLPRHHGKGKPKRKWVEHPIRVTTITYEVSLRHENPLNGSEQDVPSQTASPDTPRRPNWLRQADPGDIIYEQREIEPHTRRFPLRKDGTRQAGRVDVTYKEPKWVPILKPGKRKIHIRKKVISQQHQSSLDQSQTVAPPERPQARDDGQDERK